MVPFFAWGISKKRPDRYNLIAAFVCITGIGLVSLNDDLTIRGGDLLTLAGGVFFPRCISSRYRVFQTDGIRYR